MALPTTGQLSMSQVRTELGGSGAQSLSAAGVTLASITAGNKVALFADLAGTSAGDSITASWSNQGTPSTSSTTFQQWRYLSLAGQNSANIKTYITLTINTAVSASASMYWYHDADAIPPSGALIGTFVGSRSSSGSSSWFVPTSTTYTAPQDFLMVKLNISKSISGAISGNYTITTTYQRDPGGGTVSSYSVGTSTWNWSY